MDISLYINNSDKRVLHKNIINLATVSAELVVPSNILKPTFSIANANTINANYIYCSKFGRYYYIDEITFASGGRKIIKCSVDVLMSFVNAISALPVHIIRHSVKPSYVRDLKLPMLPDKNVENAVFRGGDFNLNIADENTYNYIINVAGGTQQGGE